MVRALEDDGFDMDFYRGLNPGSGRLYDSSSNDPENASILSMGTLMKQKAAFNSSERELSSAYNSGETSEYGLNPSPSSSDCPASTELRQQTDVTPPN